MARSVIMMMDAWTFIPLMMIMILAGLQAIPKEMHEAADVDGAPPLKKFLGNYFSFNVTCFNNCNFN